METGLDNSMGLKSFLSENLRVIPIQIVRMVSDTKVSEIGDLNSNQQLSSNVQARDE